MSDTSSNPAGPRPHWRNPLHLLAFGFGAGASPVAPGTLGTCVAVPLYLLVAQLPLWPYLTLTAAMALAAVWVCQVVSSDLGVHDHPGIVLDEIVGFFVTMVAAPSGWVWIVTGFALFRFFDVLKPWPVGFLDRRLKGGAGIVADDVAAGAMACLCIQLAAVWVSPVGPV